MIFRSLERRGPMRAQRPLRAAIVSTPERHPVVATDYRAYGPVAYGDRGELWITAKTAYACLSDDRGNDASHAWLCASVAERARSLSGLSDEEAAACSATMLAVERNAAHNPAVARLARAVADACLVSRGGA